MSNIKYKVIYMSSAIANPMSLENKMREDRTT